MEDIPDDVVALILAKLEVREIAKNRKVNRLMRSIIDQDNLIEKSLEPYLEILDLNGLIEFDKQNVYNKSYILEFEEDENVLNFKLSNVSKYTKNCRVQEVYDLRDRIDSFRSLIYGFKCDENGHKLDENYIYQGEK